jgi:hypothetical protein
MPHALRVHPAYGLGVVRFLGDVDGTALVRAMGELYTDAVWEPGFAVAWDYRGSGDFILRPSDVRRVASLADRLAPTIGRGRRALLVRRDLEARATAILAKYMVTGGNRERRTFGTATDAAAWLDVPSWLIDDPLLVEVNVEAASEAAARSSAARREREGGVADR